MFIALLVISCQYHVSGPPPSYYCEKEVGRKWVDKRLITSIEDFEYRYYYEANKVHQGCELHVQGESFPVRTRQKCEDIDQ